MRRGFALMALVALLTGGSAAAAADDDDAYKIVTASERGTYIKIGHDLGQFVAPAANLKLVAVPSAGSSENVRRLRHERQVKLALVQSDVYQAFLDLAASGNAEAGRLIRPLRVIVPLYNEEIYFIVRANSPLNYVHEIKGARINAGELGSGTALTSATLYRLMFGEAIPEAGVTFFSNEDALVRLTTEQTVDVVAVVAGQPAKLLTEMKPEARQHIKLLKFDPRHPASQAALKTYFPALVRTSSYPNLLKEDLPGLAVKAFLVTYDFRGASTADSLRRFAQSLCRNFPVLQEKGHPKWREVDLTLPELGRGWFYYPTTASELRHCRPGATQVAAQPARSCPQQQRLLGLCK
jgi:TRAP transporter TAXI family solute receptor